MPLISIVIPTYRRGALLVELFDALLPQLAGVDAEVVVVDNCPDASAHDFLAGVAARSAAVRYYHEAKSGVVHARNKGVAEARGEYILFLDDDEVPSPQWLAAFAGLAHKGVIAAFGYIDPRFAEEPDPLLLAHLDKAFSRRLPATTGEEVNEFYASLGTGNAMFHRAESFGGVAEPFDERFNQTGGEDIWLIRSLMQKGKSLVWCQEGKVEEIVPVSRMHAGYLERRRFNQGQLRCRFFARSGRMKDKIQLLLWMAIGMAQTMLWGGLMLLARAGGPGNHKEAKIKMLGGLGKVIWWRDGSTSFYSAD